MDLAWDAGEGNLCIHALEAPRTPMSAALMLTLDWVAENKLNVVPNGHHALRLGDCGTANASTCIHMLTVTGQKPRFCNKDYPEKGERYTKSMSRKWLVYTTSCAYIRLRIASTICFL